MNNEQHCNFKCLTECPAPGNCPHHDPQIAGDLVVYPDFFFWRETHRHYKEPEDKTAYRCPRCLSTNIHIGAVWIVCKTCKYNEPLIDFPENVGKNLISRKVLKDKSLKLAPEIEKLLKVNAAKTQQELPHG